MHRTNWRKRVRTTDDLPRFAVPALQPRKERDAGAVTTLTGTLRTHASFARSHYKRARGAPEYVVRVPVARVHCDDILCFPDSANFLMCSRQRAYGPEHAVECTLEASERRFW